MFPNKMKVFKIVPIHKKDNKHNIENPISLLPSISKVYENFVHNQLIGNLKQNKLLDNNQHGFQTGRSVVTTAVNFIESIIDLVDTNFLGLG